jgi:hypothetical protein
LALGSVLYWSKIAHTRNEAGADHLPVQSEPSSTIDRVLSRIRELGKKAGAVLDPGSPIAFVEQLSCRRAPVASQTICASNTQKAARRSYAPS